MINNIWKFYVLINYCGQRISKIFFAEQSVVNIIMFEISFLTSGIIIGLLSFFEIKNPLVAALIMGVFVLVIWKAFALKIKKSLDIISLEKYYLKIGIYKRVLFFLLMINLFVFSFLIMLYSVGFLMSVLS